MSVPSVTHSLFLFGRFESKLISYTYRRKDVMILLFIFGCSGSSLVCELFSSCDKLGLLVAVASLVVEHAL